MILETLPLAVHQRALPPFEELFGTSAAAALDSMNAADDDLVGARPRLPLAIAAVGYRQRGVLVHLRDPLGSGQDVPAICAVRIGTAVPVTRRGVHMSRLGDALAESVQRPYADLGAYARDLSDAVSERQYGGPTTVAVHATIPYLEQVRDSGRRAKTSLEHLRLVAKVRSGRDTSPDTELGLRFTHIVACPCVQKTYQHARLTGLPGADALAGLQPGFTHSQRCVTTIGARGLTRPLPVGQLLAALDAVIVRTINTLPRGNELALVFRAHEAPQFIEDALREALGALYRTLRGFDSFTRLSGSARSTESIHEFDLTASATITADEASSIT